MHLQARRKLASSFANYAKPANDAGSNGRPAPIPSNSVNGFASAKTTSWNFSQLPALDDDSDDDEIVFIGETRNGVFQSNTGRPLTFGASSRPRNDHVKVETVDDVRKRPIPSLVDDAEQEHLRKKSKYQHWSNADRPNGLEMPPRPSLSPAFNSMALPKMTTTLFSTLPVGSRLIEPQKHCPSTDLNGISQPSKPLHSMTNGNLTQARKIFFEEESENEDGMEATAQQPSPPPRPPPPPPPTPDVQDGTKEAAKSESGRLRHEALQRREQEVRKSQEARKSQEVRKSQEFQSSERHPTQSSSLVSTPKENGLRTPVNEHIKHPEPVRIRPSIIPTGHREDGKNGKQTKAAQAAKQTEDAWRAAQQHRQHAEQARRKADEQRRADFEKREGERHAAQQQRHEAQQKALATQRELLLKKQAEQKKAQSIEDAGRSALEILQAAANKTLDTMKRQPQAAIPPTIPTTAMPTETAVGHQQAGVGKQGGTSIQAACTPKESAVGHGQAVGRKHGELVIEDTSVSTTAMNDHAKALPVPAPAEPAPSGPMSLNSLAGQRKIMQSNQRNASNKKHERNLGEITSQDLRTMHWRDVEGLEWSRIADLAEQEFGKRRTGTTFRKRYRQISDALVEQGIDSALVVAARSGDEVARKALNAKIPSDVKEEKRHKDPWQSDAPAADSGKTCLEQLPRSRPSSTSIVDSKVPQELGKSSPLAQNQPQNDERRQTGGKTLNQAAYEHFIQQYVEMMQEEQEEATVEAASLTNEDYCHFVYQVARRQISKEEMDEGNCINDQPWIAYGDACDELAEANEAASKAIFRTPAHHSTIIDESDGFQLKHQAIEGRAFLTLENEEKGRVEVRVEKFLRTYQDGKLPGNSGSLIQRTAYIVMRATGVSGEKDDLFGEEAGMTAAAVEPVNESVYTALELANERAAKEFVRLTFQSATTHMGARLAEKQAAEAGCVKEVGEDEMFDQMHKGKAVRVWVEERRIVGPRNVL
ncbi:hypothetical protein BDY17DRAFT_325252 [Neohortaea acidophila]|uniref:Uncharacterized protein n=1 Tax=Neohortaea acidophila TaxID=245834 RepID=A0A6A6PP99_9PEZI|nr:uncharacterized protein BDY17DRAFT_325252 [Neohortaea acidophila]KAF2481735.1 hypothetical protein BDY17DRAFT_325252 [Neohortaea acidophila]